MNLEIEAMIDVEVWMKGAPELFAEDQTWIAKETRSSGIVFKVDDAPSTSKPSMSMAHNRVSR